MRSYKNLKTSRQILTSILEEKPRFYAEIIDLIHLYGESYMFTKTMVEVMKKEGYLDYKPKNKGFEIFKV